MARAPAHRQGAAFYRIAAVVEASAFSADAIARIEALGGTAVSVFHDRRGIQQLTRPHSIGVHASLPRPLLAPPMTFKERLQYSSWESRGYLHPEMRRRVAAADPTFAQRYLMVAPVAPVPKTPFRLAALPAALRSAGALPE